MFKEEEQFKTSVGVMVISIYALFCVFYVVRICNVFIAPEITPGICYAWSIFSQ